MDSEVEDDFEEKKMDCQQLQKQTSVESDFMTCNICYEMFNEYQRKPLSLPCGHTLCQECAQQLIKNGKMVCPNDKIPHRVNDAYSLSVNYSILEMITQQSQIQHSNMQIKRCGKHKRELMKFYCKTDKEFICQECLMSSDHLQKQHEICPASEVVDQSLLENELLNLHGIHESQLTQLVSTQKELDYEFNEECQKVRYFKDELHSFLEDFFVNVLSQLVSTKQKSQSKIDQEKCLLDSDHKILSGYLAQLKPNKEGQVQQNAIQSSNISMKQLKEMQEWYMKNRRPQKPTRANDFFDETPIYNIMEIANAYILSQSQNGKVVNARHIEMIKTLKSKNRLNSNRVFKCMTAIDRANFTLQANSPETYQDSAQQIGWGTTISAPHMHAYTLEILKDHLTLNGKALDIGVGSGYMAAGMSEMMGRTGQVVAVDHIQEICDFAKSNILKANAYLLNECQADLNNQEHQAEKPKRIVFKCQDGRKGYFEGGPYNVIHVGGAMESIPIELENQLKPGGRLFIPAGEQQITIIDKNLNGQCTARKTLQVQYTMLGVPANQLDNDG